MKKKYSCAIITSQAFSISNFRGPLIRDMVRAGVHVYALAPDYDDYSRKKIVDLGACPVDFQLSRTGMSPVHDLINTIRLVFLLRKLKPDVTFSYFIKPVIYGTVAAWLARIPLRIAMIEGLGYVFTDSNNKNPWYRKFLRWVVSLMYASALSRASKIIFLNKDDLNDFISKGLVSEINTIKLGGIGVDLNEWAVEPSVTEKITFLLAARLIREKGIIEYVKAARQIKARYPNTRFILLGGLDANPSGLKKNEVESWVNEGILEWPGHVEVKPWLAQASVFVLPSFYREGVPRSTQEAMAMGRPIITTDAPGCRETVEEGVNGFLIKTRDYEALMVSMIKFIEQPNLVNTMGLESRRLAEERFDVNVINARLLTILQVYD